MVAPLFGQLCYILYTSTSGVLGKTKLIDDVYTRAIGWTCPLTNCAAQVVRGRHTLEDLPTPLMFTCNWSSDGIFINVRYAQCIFWRLGHIVNAMIYLCLARV